MLLETFLSNIFLKADTKIQMLTFLYGQAPTNGIFLCTKIYKVVLIRTELTQQ